MMNQNNNIGMGSMFNTASPPPQQQPTTFGGLDKQALSDFFMAAAANAGVKNGQLDFGFGSGVQAYSDRLRSNDTEKRMAEAEKVKKEEMFLKELRGKYTIESVQAFVESGMQDYSVLKEKPKDAMFQTFVNPETKNTERYRIDPLTGERMGESLGITSMYEEQRQSTPAKAGKVNVWNSERGVEEIWTTDPYTGSKVSYLGDAKPTPKKNVGGKSKADIDKQLQDLGTQLKTVDTLLSNEQGIQNITGIVDQSAGERNEDGTLTLTGRLLQGGDEATASALSTLQTLESQNFLQAISAMKGMGALSNQEGAKVQSAITALREARSNPTAFKKKLQELREHILSLRQAVIKESGYDPMGGMVEETVVEETATSQTATSPTPTPSPTPSTRRRFNPATGKFE